MPILDLGYREWQGKKMATAFRWLAMIETGFKLCWRQFWPRRLLTYGWMPAFLILLGIFLHEQSMSDGEARTIIYRFIARQVPDSPVLDQLEMSPKAARPGVWAYLLLTYFRLPQSMLMIVLFGMVAPRLISYDLRSRSYLIYFSRPISVWQYILGKAGVLWLMIVMLVTIPGLAVYTVGLFLTEDTTAITQTWHLPLRMLLATTLLAIPTSAVALALSSWTSESRFASFSWYAIWIFGWVSYGVLTSRALQLQDEHVSMLKLVSPYHTLGILQAYAFGVPQPEDPIKLAAVIVTLVTLTAFAITYRQITKQLVA